MATDLEALYEHYRARGLGEEEAARLTEERIVTSPEVLRSLVAVHTTGYQRWLSHAAGRLRLGFELLLFVLGVFPMLAIGALAVTAPGMGMSPPWLTWPLLAIGATIAVITLWKAYQLLVRRLRSTADLHRGLFVLLFLGAISPLLAGISFLVGLHTVATSFATGAIGEPALLVAAERIIPDATLLSAGLLLGIGAGLVWFVLADRIAAIEQAESALLLATAA